MEKNSFEKVSMPPIVKPFQEMNSDEAKEYFDWHISSLSARIENMGAVLDFELKYTPNSLIELWGIILKRYARVSNKLRLNGVLEEYESILACAGLYVAEVFVRNNPNIGWVCNADTDDDDFFKNKPVLDGFYDTSVCPPFKMLFEPYHMIHVQASKIGRGTARETDLIDLYNTWCKHI